MKLLFHVGGYIDKYSIPHSAAYHSCEIFETLLRNKKYKEAFSVNFEAP